MRFKFSLADLFQFFTLLCVSLGMSVVLEITGTLIFAGLIYVGGPIYAFSTKRFREAYRMYVVWNLLCSLVCVVAMIILSFGQWFTESESNLGSLGGFMMWTIFASGPIGLIMALIIREFEIYDIGVIRSIFFCLVTMAMWILIWRIFLMRHQKAIPRGVKAETLNYLIFLLLVPAFAIFDYFAWFVLATSY